MAARQCSYFYQYQDDPSQFVFVDELDHDYTTSRIFVGTLNNMRELSVLGGDRLRYGGNKFTILESEDRFYFPSHDSKAFNLPSHGKRRLVERNKEDLPMMIFHPILKPTTKQVLEREIKRQLQAVEQSKGDLKKVADQVEYYQYEVAKYQRILEQDTAAHREKEIKLAELLAQLNQ